MDKVKISISNKTLNPKDAVSFESIDTNRDQLLTKIKNNNSYSALYDIKRRVGYLVSYQVKSDLKRDLQICTNDKYLISKITKINRRNKE